ncbi:MAG: hypothetical protein P9L98_04400 [Candidatus Kaelpia imicola]|nr:hypothetical protein [Candidatus Kaelpia imicola]
MKNYFQKYIIRPFFFLIGILIFLTVTATVLLNIYFLSSLDNITLRLTDYIGESVRLGSIYYLPPASLVLNRVEFLNISQSPYLKYIDQLKISFSIKKALLKNRIIPQSIKIKEPKIYYYGGERIKKDQIYDIVKLLRFFFSQNPALCSIENAAIIMPQKDGIQRRITLDSSLRFSGISFYSNGSVDFLKVYSHEGGELISNSGVLNYSLEGSLTQNGFLVEDLNLKKDNLYLKLQGDFLDNSLHLNGYMTAGGFLETYPDYTDLFIKLKSLIFKSKPYMQIVGSSKSILNIQDIDLLVDISYPLIQVKKVTFSLNDVPSMVYGSAMLIESPSFDFNFHSYPDQMPAIRMNNTKALDLKLTASFALNGINGNCNIDFIREGFEGNKRESVIVEFKGLSRCLDQNGEFQIRSDYLDVSYKAGQDCNLRLDDAIIVIDNAREMKNLNFSSKLFGGTLSGEGSVVIKELPLRFNISFNPVDIDSNKFDFLFFPHIFGKLSGNLNYSNYPESQLQGNIIIKDGRTEDLDFFVWFSDFFAAPSIRDIEFNNVNSSISITESSVDFKKLNLDSEDVKIKGYFKIDSDNLLSSKIRLSLSKSVIAESAKFRPLLKILGDELDYLEFDFQLSGLKDAANFKWLESEFKARLRESIPGFVERGLERKVEEVVKSFSLQPQEENSLE